MINLTFSPKILCIESTLGSIKVTNKGLSDKLKLTEEEIVKRTGIQNRYHCDTQKENIYTLMAVAASKAITSAGLTIDLIDGIYTSSNPTGEFLLPNTTSIVSSLLEKTEFYGWFGGSGCVGGILALENAYNKLSVDTMNGKASYYLVIAGDQTSKLLEENSTDQILFSDSAAAMIVTNHDIDDWKYNVQSINITTNINNSSALRLKNRELSLTHDGKSIYKFASNVVPQHISKIFQGRQFPKDTYLVPHQANLRIINNIANALNIDNQVIYSKKVQEIGNTSPTSTFIALEDLSHEKIPYRKILIATFGEGLNIGIAQLEKNNNNISARTNILENDDALKDKYKRIYDSKWTF